MSPAALHSSATLLCVIVCSLGLLLSCVQADGLTGFNYPQFESSSQNLYYIGDVSIVNNSLSLCNHQQTNSYGIVWYELPIQVRGFTTSFQFRIDQSASAPGKEGLAFVMQNEGLAVYGPYGSGMGYGDQGNLTNNRGITNSIAIEFDTYMDVNMGDPSNNHISVHSNPNGPNNAHESYSLAQGAVTAVPNFTTGNYIGVTISYVPVTPSQGTLNVWIQGLSGAIPFYSIPVSDLLKLNPANGSSWVGFTTATDSNGGSTVYISNWSFNFTGIFDPSKSIVEGLVTVPAGQGLTFTLQALDQFGNNLTTDGISASGGALSVVVTQADGQTSQASVAYIGAGKYVLNLNATKTGVTSVDLTIDNEPIGNGTYYFEVTPAAVAPGLSTVYGSGLDVTGVAGNIYSFYLQLVDIFGNNVTSAAAAKVSVNITSNNNATWVQPAQVTYEDMGRYLVSYNITQADAYTITVSLNGLPVQNPSHTLTLTPAPLYPINCIVFGEGITQPVVAGTTHEMWMQLRDVFSNNISTQLPVSSVTAQFSIGTTNVITVTPQYVANGLYHFVYNLTVSDVYTLSIQVQNQTALNGGNDAFEVVPGDIDPTESFVYGPDLEGGVAGDLNLFFVQLRDAFQNNITSNASFPTVVAFLPSQNVSITIPLTLVQNGLFSAAYNITLAGNFTLSVTVGSLPISSSNFAIVPNDLDEPSCLAYGEGLTAHPIAGEQHYIYVQLRDVFLNNITERVFADILVRFTSPAYSGNAGVFYQDSGVYVATYNITVTATYNILIAVNSFGINYPKTANITVSPAEIYPSACVAWGELSVNTLAGVSHSFFLQLSDRYHNNITSYENQTVDVTGTLVPVSGGGVNGTVPSFLAAITVLGNGTFRGDYNATFASNYTLSVQVNEEDVSNANQDVLVAPNVVYPPLAVAQPLNTSVAGVIYTFNVYLFDRYGNPITYQVPNTFAIASTPAIVVPVTYNPAAGAYTASYNVTAVGTYGLTVTIDTIPIQNSAQSFSVIPNNVDPANSLIGNIGGVAGETTTLTLTLRDAFSNNRTDFDQVSSINVTVTNGVVSAPATVTQNTAVPGTYWIQFSTTVADNFQTTILVNGVGLTQGTFLTVILPAAPDADTTLAYGAETEVVAGYLNTVFLRIRDQYGNNINDPNLPPGSFIFSLMGTPASALQYEVDLNTTYYVITYNVTLSGQFMMNITVQGVPVQGVPTDLIQVDPDVTYGPMCNASGDGVTEGKVKATTSFNITANDRYGNKRNNNTDTFQIVLSAPGEKTFNGYQSTSSVIGMYVGNYFLENKDTYTMEISTNNMPIAGSPFTVNSQYQNGSFPTWAIILIVIAGIIFIAGIAFFIYQRRRKIGYQVLD